MNKLLTFWTLTQCVYITKSQLFTIMRHFVNEELTAMRKIFSKCNGRTEMCTEITDVSLCLSLTSKLAGRNWRRYSALLELWSVQTSKKIKMARVEEWEQLPLNKQLKPFKQYVSLLFEKELVMYWLVCKVLQCVDLQMVLVCVVAMI